MDLKAANYDALVAELKRDADSACERIQDTAERQIKELKVTIEGAKALALTPNTVDLLATADVAMVTEVSMQSAKQLELRLAFGNNGWGWPMGRVDVRGGKYRAMIFMVRIGDE